MKRNKKGQKMKLLLLVVGIIVSLVIIKNVNYIYRDLVEAVNDKSGQGSTEIAKKDKWLSKEEKLELEREKEEQERLEKERQEKEEQERLEQERLEEERLEEERLKKEEEAKNKKIAYLTFDDGPSKKVTPRILDILDEYNIKATFFVVGNMINENPDILKDTYDRGHQIGNHSYNHNYGYLYKNADNFMADIYKTEELIRSIVGSDFDSKVIRFPGGSFERRKDPMKNAAREAGYNYIDWNSLNGDAEGKKRDKTQLLNRLKETTGGQKKLVVLMHDTDAKDTTAEFLRDGIEYLMEQGYEFDVLDKDYQ